MLKARKYVVVKRFQGEPKRDDYEIVETELPPIQSGEILVKVEWVSVDPYQRAYNSRCPLPYDQFGFNVGIVEDSKEPHFPVGTRVISNTGWCDYYISNANATTESSHFKIYKLPDISGLSTSLGVGAVGMLGATAYFGFLEICKPKAGETLVVTGAAGAVGSLVGQIGKLKGLKVIGFAGSDDKVQWLEKELGFDKAFNYKTVDIAAVLKQAAPNGVDCYFDNVGGEISSIILNHMNMYGKVSVCGSISAYNEDPAKMPKTTILQPSIVFKQLKLEGFIVFRWFDRWPEAFAEIINWIKKGELKPREHVTEGFENIFDAFLGMLRGENTGKAVVRI